ncbi:hypothetical protein JCM12298_29600 [Desulfothermus naphthae]
MKIKDYIIEQINNMEREDLLLLYQILNITKKTKKGQNLSKRRGYLKVRESLKNLKEPLSNTIIKDRAERI